MLFKLASIFFPTRTYAYVYAKDHVRSWIFRFYKIESRVFFLLKFQQRSKDTSKSGSGQGTKDQNKSEG
ncbi:unnamed protein product [Cuscuta campestris]|uniref:Uncharacterized protein n=1 Tax=Cuscuta campestris TaxID=132261 RepID=A0A484NJA4_9ASTE|nr:unnamed protein product [Cuscuta campestris]